MESLMKKNVEDLKCGDVFKLWGTNYLILLCLIDSLHTQSAIAAMREDEREGLV
jgi:hypothetical protein